LLIKYILLCDSNNNCLIAVHADPADYHASY